MSGGTDAVGDAGLGGNCDSGVCLVRRRMCLHRPRYGDDLVWMTIAGIGETDANLGEEVEEPGKNNDSLDVDQDYGCHRHDVEEATVGNRKKVQRLLADKNGCSWDFRHWYGTLGP